MIRITLPQKADAESVAAARLQGSREKAGWMPGLSHTTVPSTSVHLCPWQSAGSLILSHSSSSLPVFMYFRLHTDKSVPFAKLMDKIRVVPGKWGHEQGRGDKSKHLPKISGETVTLGVNITQGGQGHGLLGFCAVGRRQVV